MSNILNERLLKLYPNLTRDQVAGIILSCFDKYYLHSLEEAEKYLLPGEHQDKSLFPEGTFVKGKDYRLSRKGILKFWELFEEHSEVELSTEDSDEIDRLLHQLVLEDADLEDNSIPKNSLKNAPESRVKELRDTIEWMTSDSWEDRLKGEYAQLKIRLANAVTARAELAELFETQPDNIGIVDQYKCLSDQCKYMSEYLDCLRIRLEDLYRSKK